MKKRVGLFGLGLLALTLLGSCAFVLGEPTIDVELVLESPDFFQATGSSDSRLITSDLSFLEVNVYTDNEELVLTTEVPLVSSGTYFKRGTLFIEDLEEGKPYHFSATGKKPDGQGGFTNSSYGYLSFTASPEQLEYHLKMIPSAYTDFFGSTSMEGFVNPQEFRTIAWYRSDYLGATWTAVIDNAEGYPFWVQNNEGEVIASGNGSQEIILNVTDNYDYYYFTFYNPLSTGNYFFISWNGPAQ